MAKSSSSKSASSKKKTPTRKTAKRASSTKTTTSSKKAEMDRRKPGPKASDGERRKTDRRQKSVPVAEERRKLERRAKVNRRRQIDPTTCEREYSEAEVEFMNALELYKRKNGRMFPTCSEILEVILSLGYTKPGMSAAPESQEMIPTESDPEVNPESFSNPE